MIQFASNQKKRNKKTIYNLHLDTIIHTMYMHDNNFFLQIYIIHEFYMFI